MKVTIKIFALVFAAILFTVIINLDGLYAEGPKNGQHPSKLMEQLSDDQKTEVKSMIDDMRTAGATREEIREAVKTKFDEYGIKFPEKGQRFGRKAPYGPGLEMIADQLTEEQKSAIKEKIESLRNEGADRKEIHDEVRKMLESYGVEVPDQVFRGPRHGMRQGWESFAKDLSEEQKAAIEEKIESMKENGAERKEVYEEIRKMLESYGVELPEHGFRDSRGHMRHGWKSFGSELSDEQKQTIKEKVKSMRENDASREEIHEAVTQMLKDYGIEIPEDLEKHRVMMKNLSEDQRKEVRKTVRTMRKDGASRDEIHEAVQQLLKGYGIDLKNSAEDPNSDVNNSENGLSIQNFPNPFNPETNIQYNLQADSDVNIQIFDVQGKRVRSLVNEHQSAGSHTLRWDGLSDNGNHVPSGVYFLRLSTGSETASKRIVMAK